MKKLLVGMLVLSAAVSVNSLFAVFGSKGGGMSGSGNIATQVETGDIDVSVGPININLFNVDYTNMNLMCSDGATCVGNIGTGSLNAVGDMYALNLNFAPIYLGNITQEKYISNPFAQSDTVYFTYFYNGMEFEVALALLSYNRADYADAEWAMLPSQIQNEILRSDASVNSAVKMLLRRKSESNLWLEVMNAKFESTVNQIVRFGSVASVGVNENGLPFAMFKGVAHQGETYPGVELIVSKEVVMPAVMGPRVPARRR